MIVAKTMLSLTCWGGAYSMKKYTFIDQKLFEHIVYSSLIALCVLIQILYRTFLWWLTAAGCVFLFLYIVAIVDKNVHYYLAIDQQGFFITKNSVHQEKSMEPIFIGSIKEIKYTEPKRSQYEYFPVSGATVHTATTIYPFHAMLIIMNDGASYLIDVGGISLRLLKDLEKTMLTINPSIRIAEDIVSFYKCKTKKHNYSSKYPLKEKDDNHEEHLK